MATIGTFTSTESGFTECRLCCERDYAECRSLKAGFAGDFGGFRSA
ncbi:hypothetical protein [Rhizobium sp. 2TAF27]